MTPAPAGRHGHYLSFVSRVAAFVAAGVLLCACEPPAPLENDDSLRIVTLAPHLTELVFAAGAGEFLVGVSAYSDYPPEALELPIVSDAFTVDQERLALLAPTLVLAWDGGNPGPLIDELAAAGYRVESIRTHGLSDVPAAIERIGVLAGRETVAEEVSGVFRDRIEELRAQYSQEEPVSVFYQVSSRPLYTVGGTHYISDIIRLCGGHNVFNDLDELAPAIGVEAVIDRDPEVMLAANADGGPPFAIWDRWSHIQANRFDNRFTVDADEIARPSVRLVSAAAAVCEHLHAARQRTAGNSNDPAS